MSESFAFLFGIQEKIFNKNTETLKHGEESQYLVTLRRFSRPLLPLVYKL